MAVFEKIASSVAVYIHRAHGENILVRMCEKDLKREDRTITTLKLNTAPGKALSHSPRRERPSEEVIYFSSGDGNWRAMGRAPEELLTGDVPSRGYCLSSPSFSHTHSLSISHLSDLRLPLSLWKEGEKEKNLCLPLSQFIPHCGLQNSAWLCPAVIALLKRGVLQAPPRLVYVGSVTFYPSPPH